LEIGRANGNADLELLAMTAVGNALVQQRRIEEGMALLEVKAALARYHQAHAELEQAAQEGIVALRGRRAGARTQSTRR
jgi:hypothetical protein